MRGGREGLGRRSRSAKARSRMRLELRRVPRALWGLRPGVAVRLGTAVVPNGFELEVPMVTRGIEGRCIVRATGMPQTVVTARSQGICAGDEPALIDPTAASNPHDVSCPTGDGEARCRGVVPRAKNSMTIMRPPQHGHGVGQMRGALSTGAVGSGFGPAFGTARSSRAVVIASLRLPLASKP